jgi:hypothetical protein
MKTFLAVLFFALLCACSAPEPSGVKAIVGARMEPGSGQAPIEHSVVIVENGKIREAGPQATTPVPKGAEITGGPGRIVRGDIEPGAPANLEIVDAATGKVEATMRNGEWVK